MLRNVKVAMYFSQLNVILSMRKASSSAQWMVMLNIHFSIWTSGIWAHTVSSDLMLNSSKPLICYSHYTVTIIARVLLIPTQFLEKGCICQIVKSGWNYIHGIFFNSLYNLIWDICKYFTSYTKKEIYRFFPT